MLRNLIQIYTLFYRILFLLGVHIISLISQIKQSLKQIITIKDLQELFSYGPIFSKNIPQKIHKKCVIKENLPKLD